MRSRQSVAACVLALLVAGCGGAPHSPGSPLGRSIAPTRQPSRATPTGADAGDPPSERGGKIPPGAQAAQQTVAAGVPLASARAALELYALLYVNWRAAQLPARELELARLSVGTARLRAEQTLAGRSGAAALAADDVANHGEVLSIAPGEGSASGGWVVVTQEQTTGSGAYAGLPPGPHVTLARVTRLRGGWVVSAWDPAS
jgi:hypothetical protein